MVPMQVYSEGQLDRQVEERLRTFMQNGTDPEELEGEVEKRREKMTQHG